MTTLVHSAQERSIPTEQVETPAAYTPGPWKIAASVDDEFIGIYPSTGRPEFPICKMPEYVRADVLKANARLLASAPDLIDMLDQALEFIASYEDVNDGDSGVPEPNRAMTLASEIRVTIAKAEGRA